MQAIIAIIDIYISSKTACSSKEDYSKTLYALTNNMDISKSSLRVSFSKDNTKEELINSLFKLSNQFCDELYKNVSYIDTDGRYKELVDSYRFTIKEG